MPLDIGPDSFDVRMRLNAVEGDLFFLGLITPKFALDLRKQGVPEEDVLDILVVRPYMPGTTSGDF